MYYAVLVTTPEPPRARRRHTFAMILVALLGLPLGAAAAGRAIDFLPAVQTLGENSRLLVANLKNQAGGLPPDPCKGSIAFYDAAGNLVAGKTQPFSLMPGASQVFNSNFVNATGGVFALRARVTFPPAPKSGLDTCGGLGANYEVFDTSTSQTRIMNPGVIRGFNPQPDPPGFEDAGQ